MSVEPGVHIIGTDGPRPEATRGTHLHHTCLRISDPAKTLPFFKEVLGFRSLFTYNAGSFTIYYMYIGDESADVVWARFSEQDSKGFVELIHRHGSDSDGTSYSSGNGVRGNADRGVFAHLGMIVDDAPKMTERALAAGATLVKPQFECSPYTIGWPEDTPSPLPAFQKLYGNMTMIEFDGIWFELVPKVLDL